MKQLCQKLLQSVMRLDEKKNVVGLRRYIQEFYGICELNAGLVIVCLKLRELLRIVSKAFAESCVKSMAPR